MKPYKKVVRQSSFTRRYSTPVILSGTAGHHHFVEILSAADNGNVTLINMNYLTLKPLKDAKEYTINLYTDGTITYL